jgi:hypothetical protein
MGCGASLLVLAFVVAQGRVGVAHCKWSECRTTFAAVRNGEWGWVDVKDNLIAVVVVGTVNRGGAKEGGRIGSGDVDDVERLLILMHGDCTPALE